MSQKTTSTKRNTIEIYDHDKMIAQTFVLIKRDLSQEHYDLAKQYDIAMVKDALSKSTRLKQLKMLLSLGRLLNKDWSKITENDIDQLVVRIMDTYSDSGKETETTKDHKKVLKLFFRWYRLGSRSFRKVGDPPETKDIVVKKPADKIVRENLLDEKDLANILKACGENARDRAFLHVHYDATTRPGEILTLQIKHVKRDKFGAVIAVDGKTGTRPIRLIESVPSLNSWLAVHPFKDDPEAPLWVSMEKIRYGKPMTLKGAQIMLAKRCKIAGISKRVNLKLFRHSGATNVAQFLSDELMKKRMGWSKNSTMPSRYSHMNNADVERAIFKEYGIMDYEDKKTAKLPKICNICEMVNTPDSKSCSKCGRPLNLETALELEETENENQDSIKNQMNEMKKELEELKYGPTGRMNKYNKLRVNTPNTPEMQLFTTGFPILLELLLHEEKKRDMMKELEQAKLENRKPDLHKVFGTPRMTEEQVQQLRECVKEYRSKYDHSKPANNFKPRFRIENLEATLADYN